LRTPAATSIFAQAVPAAPVPVTTTLISSIFLPTIFNALIAAGQHDDRRPVLIVVKDRNVQLFAQTALDLEAARRGDVFQVDAAKDGRDVFDRAHDLVHVFRVEADGERRQCLRIL
jgi:hypothetical protein